MTSWTPNWVRRCRRSSRMARAWVSERLYEPSSLILWVGSSINLIYSAISCAGHRRVISFSLASAASAEERMVATTSSTLETATAKPHKIWLRSRALRNSNATRRATTSSRKSMKFVRKERSVNCSGRPPFKASMLQPKDVCIGVKR